MSPPIRARRCATNATKISFLRPKLSSNELSKVVKNPGHTDSGTEFESRDLRHFFVFSIACLHIKLARQLDLARALRSLVSSKLAAWTGSKVRNFPLAKLKKK